VKETHFATIWEQIADQQPEAPAVVCGNTTRNWREYEDRAARIAAFLSSRGASSDTKVGLYLHNCNEYLECQFGVMKMRGVTINVNYRYLEEELIYLLDNSDSEVVVYQACYAPRIEAIRARLPNVHTYIRVDDDSSLSVEGDVELEQIISSHQPMARISRSEDDLYMFYTGGTTGMPKGVMYTCGEFSLGLTVGWVALAGMEAPPASPEALAEASAALYASGNQVISLVTCPLMHGTGMWLGALIPHMMGGAVITTPNLGLDPQLIWSEVIRNRASIVVIVGDAFAKPLLAELERAEQQDQRYDLSSLKMMSSSGAMWSQEVKDALLTHRDMVLMDAMGSTEGSMGTSMSTRADISKTAAFALGEDVNVLNEHDQEVEPGSGEQGMIGTPGSVPLGYYKDQVKSAATFREIAGVRYSFPGDLALVEADGSITLLGRGSNCINTAGEKVFPEEVEEAIKKNPAILDCLVVGLADERFGQRVVAVASIEPGQDVSEKALIEYTRKHLSGYKLPKQVLFVPTVQRAPNGKADYKWAKEFASSQ
jgi:acyl-CoA synthetase (AMP-forming)/AMP-acid ligase II